MRRGHEMCQRGPLSPEPLGGFFMSNLAYDTPQSAAMTGFPDTHCQVVTSRVLGNDAYVLSNTGSRTRPYLYGVNCARKNGQWFERSSARSPGWGQTGHNRDVCTLSLWGEAPDGAEAVRVAFGGDLIEELMCRRPRSECP